MVSHSNTCTRFPVAAIQFNTVCLWADLIYTLYLVCLYLHRDTTGPSQLGIPHAPPSTLSLLFSLPLFLSRPCTSTSLLSVAFFPRTPFLYLFLLTDFLFSTYHNLASKMASTLYLMLTDPPTLILMATALSTAAYAAYRANQYLLTHNNSSPYPHVPSFSDQVIDENARLLEHSMAIAFPIIASVSIVFLFFFLGSIGFVLTILTAISSFFSVFFLIWPFGEVIAKRIRSSPLHIRPAPYLETAICVPIVVTIIITWLFTGHWIPNNLIGISLCIFFASLCKVPNLKVTAILFVGLFVYDIFFVFFSESIFGTNVMVQVATSTPQNPASALAKFFNLPFSPVHNLALPAKIIVPTAQNRQAILGLGDIILPEVLLVYLMEFDIRNGLSSQYKSYFWRALIAFAFGLEASFFFNFTFHVAQPALLYIVPSIMLPTLLLAKKRGQLSLLWNGPPRPFLEHSYDHTDEIAVSSSTSSKVHETTSLMA